MPSSEEKRAYHREWRRRNAEKCKARERERTARESPKPQQLAGAYSHGTGRRGTCETCKRRSTALRRIESHDLCKDCCETILQECARANGLAGYEVVMVNG